MSEETFITTKEKQEFERELEHLKKVERVKILEQLKVARSYGDLRENSEYDAARKKQAAVEGRIGEIENILKSTRVVNEDHEIETVTIGNTVDVEISGQGKKIFDIGTKGKNIAISPHSPIAKGLLGKRVGEIVTLTIPKGPVTMKIADIS